MTGFDLPARSLLMDDARPGGAAWLFRDPVDWIVADEPEAVPSALARIDEAVAGGQWVAGMFAFELGYLLEPRLRPLYRPSRDPLIAAGIYAERVPIDGFVSLSALSATRNCRFESPVPALGATQYDIIFQQIQKLIESGDIYQLNFTWPLSLPFAGDPFAMLAAWRAKARAGHAAILRLDDRDILSFSPESFLQSSGDGILRTRPMKGTTARGADLNGDAAAIAALTSDPKQRAENLMIVDLLRNDLSRICEPGSVRVNDLFTVETYPTLHTMTSGIEGHMRPGIQPSDVLAALFPCGSVTGAPKVRAMEIIAEVEPQTRGVYCGTIGAIGPGLRLDLNVAIRTLVHEHGGSALRMGVGGGVVFDSGGASEYAECLLKARFATDPPQPFDLLETLRWSSQDGFAFLPEHLARLAAAAHYFMRSFDEAAIIAALDAHVAGLDGTRRVRLLLDDAGTPRVESTLLDGMFSLDLLEAGAPPLRLAIAATRLNSSDPFVRHKATRRAVYDDALAGAKAQGADEAILLNEHGRIADGSFMTLFALIDGALHTPPAAEGALPGILKQILIQRGLPPVIERPLTLADLRAAAALFAGNSFRGLRRAELIEIHK